MKSGIPYVSLIRQITLGEKKGHPEYDMIDSVLKSVVEVGPRYFGITELPRGERKPNITCTARVAEGAALDEDVRLKATHFICIQRV